MLPCAAGRRGISPQPGASCWTAAAPKPAAPTLKRCAATPNASAPGCSRLPDTARPSEELRLLSAITPKGPVFYHGTVQALADRYIVFRDDYGAISRLLLELIRAEALARGYQIITCPCAMHPEDQIDHLFIPSLRLAFLTDNPWHPVHISGVQAVRCTRFLDREHMAGFRARLRFNERAATDAAGPGRRPRWRRPRAATTSWRPTTAPPSISPRLEKVTEETIKAML